jgi:hypothetical protein
MARKKARKDATGLRGLQDGRLSYGTPVAVDGRTVITVSRVRAVRSGASRTVDSVPVGYIEVSGEGSAFHPIEGGDGARNALRAAVATVTTIAGALAGARALRAPRRGPRLLPPGRSRLHR